MARIELKDIQKTLKGEGRERSSFRIDGLDLEIPDGKVLAILGPSGCGKSTLLRIIAGLAPLDSGRVLFDGVDSRDLPPSERKIGMVFQNYALYPNFDSKTNVLSYFMFRKKTPELEKQKEELYRRTAELLGVEIEKLMGRMPKGLSGGEQQRVAIARCITRDPRLFLLDEPFSNLDAKLREKYRVQLRVLLKQFNITTVYVTHDQVEALILADLIALMNGGRIEQVGSAQEIWDTPRNVFAADFLNFEPETPAINLIDGELVSAEYSRYTLGARPEHLVLSPLGPASPQDGAAASGARVRAKVVDLRPVPLRKLCIVTLRVAGAELYARVPVGSSYARGQELEVSFAKCHLFDKESGLRERTIG
jgi:multiple sugar transport system ATP-binding protein